MLKRKVQTEQVHESSHLSPGRRVGRVAAFVLVLNILAFTVLLVGWLAGWFHFSAGSGDLEGQYHVKMTINAKEVAADVESATEEINNAGEAVQAATELTTVEATVIDRDAALGTVLFSDKDEKQFVVHVNDTTDVNLEGGEGSINELDAGDDVHLVYKEKNGKKFAMKIERSVQN